MESRSRLSTRNVVREQKSRVTDGQNLGSSIDSGHSSISSSHNSNSDEASTKLSVAKDADNNKVVVTVNPDCVTNVLKDAKDTDLYVDVTLVPNGNSTQINPNGRSWRSKRTDRKPVKASKPYMDSSHKNILEDFSQNVVFSGPRIEQKKIKKKQKATSKKSSCSHSPNTHDKRDNIVSNAVKRIPSPEEKSKSASESNVERERKCECQVAIRTSNSASNSPFRRTPVTCGSFFTSMTNLYIADKSSAEQSEGAGMRRAPQVCYHIPKKHSLNSVSGAHDDQRLLLFSNRISNSPDGAESITDMNSGGTGQASMKDTNTCVVRNERDSTIHGAPESALNRESGMQKISSAISSPAHSRGSHGRLKRHSHSANRVTSDRSVTSPQRTGSSQLSLNVDPSHQTDSVDLSSSFYTGDGNNGIIPNDCFYFYNPDGQVFMMPNVSPFCQFAPAMNAVIPAPFHNVPSHTNIDLNPVPLLGNLLSMPNASIHFASYKEWLKRFLCARGSVGTNASPLAHQTPLWSDNSHSTPLGQLQTCSRQINEMKKHHEGEESRPYVSPTKHKQNETCRLLGIARDPSGLLGNARTPHSAESKMAKFNENFKNNGNAQRKHSSKTNLYIRGLPDNFTEEQLHDLTPDKTLIRSVKLIAGNEGEMYGFIDFTNNAAAKTALSHIKSNNRGLYVNFAYESEKDPQNVYITNIPETWTAENVEDLKKVFEEYGPIATAIVMTKRSNNFCTGAGFVRFIRAEDAQKAIEGVRNAKVILDQNKGPLEVKLADRQRPPDEKDATHVNQRTGRTVSCNIPNSSADSKLDRIIDKRKRNLSTMNAQNTCLQNFINENMLRHGSNWNGSLIRPAPNNSELSWGINGPLSPYKIDLLRDITGFNKATHQSFQSEWSTLQPTNPNLFVHNQMNCIGLQIPVMINTGNGYVAPNTFTNTPVPAQILPLPQSNEININPYQMSQFVLDPTVSDPSGCILPVLKTSDNLTKGQFVFGNPEHAYFSTQNPNQPHGWLAPTMLQRPFPLL